jgi:hypothetical protein
MDETRETKEQGSSTEQKRKSTIIVVTSEEGMVRGGTSRRLNAEELSVNVNLFLEQMSGVLEKAPTQIGKFQFAEFEVHADITAKGSLALLGTGGEVGASGGLKFVFRRVETR